MGPTIGETCLQHLTFMKWADQRLIAAVAEHMPASLSTLQHIYLGELVWLARLCGDGNSQIAYFEAPADVAELQRAWASLHESWLVWASSVPDWAEQVPHRNQKGDEFRMPAWQIALHVVNHGSFHRGQVAAMLRAGGIAPPATDLIIWYRENAG